MKAKDFVALSKRVLESNKALHTVYTKENKAVRVEAIKSMVSQK
jgi:hypothetical protein